jgi:hypothetical protein
VKAPDPEGFPGPAAMENGSSQFKNKQKLNLVL